MRRKLLVMLGCVLLLVVIVACVQVIGLPGTTLTPTPAILPKKPSETPQPGRGIILPQRDDPPTSTPTKTPTPTVAWLAITPPADNQDCPLDWTSTFSTTNESVVNGDWDGTAKVRIAGSGGSVSMARVADPSEGTYAYKLSVIDPDGFTTGFAYKSIGDVIDGLLMFDAKQTAPDGTATHRFIGLCKDCSASLSAYVLLYRLYASNDLAGLHGVQQILADWLTGYQTYAMLWHTAGSGTSGLKVWRGGVYLGEILWQGWAPGEPMNMIKVGSLWGTEIGTTTTTFDNVNVCIPPTPTATPTATPTNTPYTPFPTRTASASTPAVSLTPDDSTPVSTRTPASGGIDAGGTLTPVATRTVCPGCATPFATRTPCVVGCVTPVATRTPR